MRVLIDTNVLLRLDDTSHQSHTEAQAAVEWLIANHRECVLVPQVLYEFWVVATRPIDANGLGLSTARAEQAISGSLNIFRVLGDERLVLKQWRELVNRYDVKGKNAHDARLVAAMQRHGVTNLLTFNGADFARFPGINIYSPAEVLAGRLPV